jgi:hypothetical protein
MSQPLFMLIECYTFILLFTARIFKVNLFLINLPIHAAVFVDQRSRICEPTNTAALFFYGSYQI